MNGIDRVTLATQFGEWTSRLAMAAEEVQRIAGPALSENDVSSIRGIVDRACSRGLYVVVCGEFKRGKSNLCNAILRQRDVFPVDEDVATSIVTLVTYGDTERAHVYVKGASAPREIELEAVRQYATEPGNPGNREQVQLVSIRGPFAALAPGVAVIDTPGAGSLNVEHTAATLAFLPYADAVVMVVDAVEPVTTKELEFVDTVRQSSTNMVFAVTKADLVADPSVMVRNLRGKLVDRYGNEGAAIPIVTVSSARMLDGLDDNEPELVEESGIGQLEEQLWGVLLRRAAVNVLLEATGGLRCMVDHVLVPLRSQLISLTEAPARSAELRRQLVASGDRLEAAAEPGAAWRGQLQGFLAAVGTEVRSDFETSVGQLRSDLGNVWLQNPELLACPEELARNLVSGLMLGLNAGTERMRDALNLAYVRIEDDLELDLRRKELDAITFDPRLLELPSVARTPQSLLRRARGYVISHWDVGGITDVLEGVVGIAVTLYEVFGAPHGGYRRPFTAQARAGLGALSQCSGDLASAAGHIRSGVRDLRDKDLETRKNELSAMLRGYLELNGVRASEALHAVTSHLSGSIAADIDGRIAEEHAMVSKSLRNMDGSPSESSIEEREELSAQIDELTRLAGIVDQLHAEVMGESAPHGEVTTAPPDWRESRLNVATTARVREPQRESRQGGPKGDFP
jgi:GTP-binding protein EngB required for normal cell division